MRLKKTFRFEASHVLPKHPGKCSRMHGHSWVLHVCVEGMRDLTTGFVMDYADISSVVRPLIETIDHTHLGTWEAFRGELIQANWLAPWLPLNIYPTSENLLVAFGSAISLKGMMWSMLILEETCTSEARMTREEWHYEATRK